MRQLFPHVVDAVDLAAVYGELPAVAGRPSVRLNMVASVDGRTAVNGVSGPLGGPADLQVFRFLRSLADVVLVAAGTVRAENYKPAPVNTDHVAARRARGQADTPRIAVVSRRLDLDWGSPLFAPPARTIVVTTEDAPPTRLRRARETCLVLTCGNATVDFVSALEQLSREGVNQILCEGGPSLNHTLAAHNLIDELCLTISPRLVGGDAKHILAGPAFDRAVHLTLCSLLEQDGLIFTRYRPQNSRPRHHQVDTDV